MRGLDEHIAGPRASRYIQQYGCDCGNRWDVLTFCEYGSAFPVDEGETICECGKQGEVV